MEEAIGLLSAELPVSVPAAFGRRKFFEAEGLGGGTGLAKTKKI